MCSLGATGKRDGGGRWEREMGERWGRDGGEMAEIDGREMAERRERDGPERRGRDGLLWNDYNYAGGSGLLIGRGTIMSSHRATLLAHNVEGSVPAV